MATEKYRVTHQEKTGVVKELKRLEAKFSQEYSAAVNTQKCAEFDLLMAKPEVKALIKKHKEATKAVKDTQNELNKMGISIGYNSEPQADGRLRDKNKSVYQKKYDEKMQKLSTINMQIQLATYREDVAALVEEASRI